MNTNKNKKTIASAIRSRIIALILALTVFLSYMSPVLPVLIKGSVVPSADTGYSMEDWMEQNEYESGHEELDVIPDSVDGTDVSYRPPVTPSVKTSPIPQTSRPSTSSVSKVEKPVDDEPAIVYSDDELVLTGEANGITVIVQAERDAFPESVYMQVRPVEIDLSDVVDDTVGSAESFTAIDISFFDAEYDVEIEPAKPIKVNMVSTDMLDADDAAVVHLDDEGAATVVDNTLKNDTVSFSSGEFSVYILVKKVIEKTVLASDGNAYDVTVTYGPDANIPEGSTLSVTEIDSDSYDYSYAFNSVIADKIEKGESVDFDTFNLVAFDISIISPDGDEIEPEATVQVDIRIKDLPGVEDLDEIVDTIEIQHHVEVADGVVIDKVFDGTTVGTYEMDTKDIIVSEGTVVDPDAIDAYFESDSFSTFTVTWNSSSASNTNGTLRWRSSGSTRAQVRVNYVDESGTAITRPNNVFNSNGNYDINVGGSNFDNTVTIDANNLAKAINNRSYLSAYTVVNNQNVQVTRIVAQRGNNGNTTVTYYNGETSVWSGSGGNNFNAQAIYLVYSGTSSSNTVTVHYVDESGKELNIGNPATTYPNITPSSDTPAYLIYDIDGYEYDHAYRNTDTSANRFVPQLSYSNSVWRYCTGYTTSGGWVTTYTPQYSNLAAGDELYIVYKQKAEPSQGGTPQVDPDTETWPDQETPPDKPTFSKSSTNQGDGTNLISLSITAAEKPVVQATPADVIVVFDNSYSMSYYDIDGGTSGTRRLQLAKNAVNAMADTLLNGQNTDVRMALVSFGTDAQVEQGFTDNYTTFSGKVNSLTGPSSERTNWEKGLYLANTSTQLSIRDNAATFVVFVTDGNPTVRMSRGDFTNAELTTLGMRINYYSDNYLFGDGEQNEDNYQSCYDPAVPQVEAIAASNKSFYAIGISEDVDRLQQLMSDTGQPESNAFSCEDENALTTAFASITEAIRSTLGFGDIEITDGITDLTHAEMKVMETVDPESFKYYRYGGEGNKYGTAENMSEWTVAELQTANCGLASYDEDTGAVHWNMGNRFQLEDGVTYVVTFRVWPSQDAYDLVADLNNGVKVYQEGESNSITAAERAQVVENSPPTATSQGSYALKTNTNEVNATYQRTTKTGDTVTVNTTQPIKAYFDNSGKIENMNLESMKLTIKKEFEDDLTAGEDRETEVTLVLMRRIANQQTVPEFEPYAFYHGGSTTANIVLNAANDWKFELYVAPGFKVGEEVLEHGYDFTITEPGIDYHYGLIEEIINPMVVDGHDVYYGDGYLLDDEALIDKYKDQSLTAVNRVKSGIDVRKKAFEADGTTEIKPDDEFTIHGRLVDENNNGYLFNTEWDNREDKSTAAGASEEWVAHQNDSGAYHLYDQDGTRIGYKLHVADTSDFTITLKAGQYVRFINVPEGSEFEFYEVTSGNSNQYPEHYEFMSATGVTQHRVSAGGDFTQEGDVQPTVSSDGTTVSLSTGVVGNKQYSVVINNKRTIELPEVELVKVDTNDHNIKLNGAEFKLYKDADKTTEVTKNADGNTLSIVTGNKENSTGPDGWYYIGKLAPGTYYLFETEAPSNYDLNDTPVIITVTANAAGNSATISATQGDVSVLSGTSSPYTITVEDDSSIKWIRIKKVDAKTGKPIGGAQFSFDTGGTEAITVTSHDVEEPAEGATNISGFLFSGDQYTFNLASRENAYTLSETAAPDGYNILTGTVNVFVSPTGVHAYLGDDQTVDLFDSGNGTENDPYLIIIKNTAGTELPEAGGPGVERYHLIGGMIVLTSVLWIYLRRKHYSFG